MRGHKVYNIGVTRSIAREAKSYLAKPAELLGGSDDVL
ncbi:hypothetical protein L1283_005105 [Sphingobacterium sp. HSC-15S19]